MRDFGFSNFALNQYISVLPEQLKSQGVQVTLGESAVQSIRYKDATFATVSTTTSDKRSIIGTPTILFSL